MIDKAMIAAFEKECGLRWMHKYNLGSSGHDLSVAKIQTHFENGWKAACAHARNEVIEECIKTLQSRYYGPLIPEAVIELRKLIDSVSEPSNG